MRTKQTDEKKDYLSPLIEVVEAEVEEGFALSVEAEDTEVERSYGVW